MSVVRLLGREIRFWGNSILVCTLPLYFIHMLADRLGFSTPFHVVDPGTPHPGLGMAQLGFLALVAVFYTMRSMDRVAYGFAEIILALIGFNLLYQHIVSSYSSDTFLLTTGGFTYVAVRGVDNIVTGAKRHYTDPSTDPRWFW